MDEEAINLLRRAHEVLKDRWFISDDDDEYNDEEVIGLDQDIEKYLASFLRKDEI